MSAYDDVAAEYAYRNQPARHYKESLFGSFEQVQKILKCPHVWWLHEPGYVLQYIPVSAICVLCKTRRK